MEKEFQKKSLDRFFPNEYKKLLGFARRNAEDRFPEASPEDIVQDVMVGLIDKLDLDVQIGNLTGISLRSFLQPIVRFFKGRSGFIIYADRV